MPTLANVLGRAARREDGVTALEYALIAALIAVVIVGAVGTLGGSLSNTFTMIANAF
jgi:pilus assembly protein Flp/PilA